MKPDVLIAVAIACAAHCFAHGASKAADAPRAAIVSRDIGAPRGQPLGRRRMAHDRRRDLDPRRASRRPGRPQGPQGPAPHNPLRPPPLPFTEPGSYTLRAKASGFPNPYECEHRYAVILHPPALTEKQKDDSPYGINVHGGSYVGYDKFAKLGFTWVRDYAFNYLWMVRARGEGGYKGWPWYPKIIKAAEDAGMRTLPCLMNAAQCRNEDPATPTDEWRSNIALIVSTFPQLSAFELDNEHGDPMSEKYGEYHRVFAEIMKACRPNALSVQEGCASIHIFGAKLKPSGKRKLDVAPVWYIGLDPECDWLKQCPIDLERQSETMVSP